MTATVHAIQSPLPVTIDDNLPPVRVVIDDDTWDVDIDVTRQIDLPGLFTAIAEDPHLRNAVRILQWNKSNRDLRACAVADLLKDARVRAALTINVSPGQAETLGIALDDASREPFERCGWYDLGASCSNFVTIAGAELCGEHQAFEDEDTTLEPVRS